MAEVAKGNVIPIRSRYDALKWGDEQQAWALRLEAQLWRVRAALLLAEAQRDASNLLLRVAEAECERLRTLIK